jgi:hypothetical protein
MVIAKWEGVVIAESNDCVVVEGNQYVSQHGQISLLTGCLISYDVISVSREFP